MNHDRPTSGVKVLPPSIFTNFIFETFGEAIGKVGIDATELIEPVGIEMVAIFFFDSDVVLDIQAKNFVRKHEERRVQL